MSDTPELGRYCVLQTALLKRILETMALALPDDLTLELDALTMLIANRSRSAVDYHKTARGQAQLADAAKIFQELGGDKPIAEWENIRWSLEQAQGPFKPTDEPEDVVDRWLNISQLELLSESFTRPAPAPPALPEE